MAKSSNSYGPNRQALGDLSPQPPSAKSRAGVPANVHPPGSRPSSWGISDRQVTAGKVISSKRVTQGKGG
jgi:hypothetical protein